VLGRVKDEVREDRLSIISAGISYYCLLGVFPGIAMIIMIYGLVGDAATVREQIGMLSEVMPAEAYSILAQQLESVSASEGRSLGIGVALTFSLAAWSASRAISALVIAMNIAYEEREQRGIVKLNLIALGLTLGGACFLIIALAVIAAVPAAIRLLGASDTIAASLAWLRWGALGIAAVVGLAIVYRYAPCRSHARFEWVTPGALIATVLWLLSSLLFSFYVTNFGSYNETFGSIGAVVVLLLWFYISAFAVCIGAELNAELERQTYRDTTTGPTRPIGRRGAYVADHTVEAVELRKTE
jgi:membrane protein